MSELKQSSEAGSAAFSQLLILEQEFLRALIRTIGVAPSDVADVLQDANLYLVENQSKFVPGTNFRAWAAQVARYRCMNYFRTRKNRPMVALSDEILEMITTEVVDTFDDFRIRSKGLQHCMSKLPEDQRELLAKVYGQNESLKEVAEQQGASYVAVRKTISRIRHALRNCIRKWVNA